MSQKIKASLVHVPKRHALLLIFVAFIHTSWFLKDLLFTTHDWEHRGKTELDFGLNNAIWFISKLKFLPSKLKYN